MRCWAIDAGQGGGQVVAQGQPVAGFVAVGLFLPGEDALVRAVNVGEEFAQRLDGFNRGAFEGVEAVGVVDPRDGIEHRLPFGHVSAEVVAEAFGRFSLWAGGLFDLCHGIFGVRPYALSRGV